MAQFLISTVVHFLVDNRIPGSPDIVMTKYKCVIFVNGCFWHGHEGCKYFVIPKTRTDWWLAKINRTKERDAENYSQLEKEGWRVFILWECEIEHDFEQTMDNLVKNIRGPHVSQTLKVLGG